MDKQFEPLSGLELIQRTIEEAKTRFQENGFVYMFWGALVAICALGQFILEQANTLYPFLIWLLAPVGSIFTMLYFSRKNRNKPQAKNVITSILNSAGIIVGVNIFILGFGFWPFLGQAFTPVVIVILSFYTMIIGKALQFRFMFFSGLVTNVFGFLLFFVALEYHALGTAIAGIFLLLIPGIILYRKHKAS